MRRRRHEIQAARRPLGIRLTEPRIKDFVTEDEWRRTTGQSAGKRLHAIAAPRWAAEVGEWFSEWSESSDDSAEVVVVDFQTAQRAACGAADDEGRRLTNWARGVVVGVIDPVWSVR